MGDAHDNPLAESFVDSFKTELIADRVWRSRSQLELAIVECVGWFNMSGPHEALGDVPPAEFEALAVAATFQLSRPLMKEGKQISRSPQTRSPAHFAAAALDLRAP